jgi:uncharacterized protein (DUF4415 family)
MAVMSENPEATPPSRFAATKTARLARARLERLIDGQGDDLTLWRKVQKRVPDAWATLEEDIDCQEERVKITIRIDTSVARFYRAMGSGYQARMNRILATYAQMKIGEVERERQIEKDLDAYLENLMPDEVLELARQLGAELDEEARAALKLAAASARAEG